jgi:hypothetical protein
MEKMWKRVSAEYYRMTKQAVNPEDIRDKFTGRVG